HRVRKQVVHAHAVAVLEDETGDAVVHLDAVPAEVDEHHRLRLRRQGRCTKGEAGEEEGQEKDSQTKWSRRDWNRRECNRRECNRRGCNRRQAPAGRGHRQRRASETPREPSTQESPPPFRLWWRRGRLLMPPSFPSVDLGPAMKTKTPEKASGAGPAARRTRVPMETSPKTPSDALTGLADGLGPEVLALPCATPAAPRTDSPRRNGSPASPVRRIQRPNPTPIWLPIILPDGSKMSIVSVATDGVKPLSHGLSQALRGGEPV